MFLGSLRMKSQRRELITMAIKLILPKNVTRSTIARTSSKVLHMWL
jgi:hypothetical protein